MALTIDFTEGFSNFSSAALVARDWDAGSVADYINTGPFSYGYAASITSGYYLKKTLTAQTIVYLGFHFNVSTSINTSTYNIVNFQDAGNAQVEISVDRPNRRLRVYRNGNLLGSTSNGVFEFDTWAYLEASVKIDSTTGEVHLRVWGGALGSPYALDLTSQNTQNTANATVDTIVLWQGGTVNGNIAFANVYHGYSASATADFVGESRIYTNSPNSDGTTVQWTPSVGSNFQCVDEMPPPTAPNDDTDYVSDATSGHIDLYGFPALSLTQVILAVNSKLCAEKDDVGARQIQHVCRSGVTNFLGTAINLTNSYAEYSKIYQVDPNTSSAWTSGNLDSAQLGAKVV